MSQVTVIIPTVNRPVLLKRAIVSVLNQTFQDLEIIVIDDGEGEGRGIVSALADQRIFYFKNQEKKGGAGSRNAGIQQAKSPFVAFLDDDDEWLPTKLALQLKILRAAPADIGFCFTAVTNVYDNGQEETTTVPDGPGNYLPLALKRFNGFLTSTLLIKKSVLDEIGGFDEKFPSHQEPDLIIRLSQRYKGVGLNQSLVRMNMSRQYEHISSKLERRIAGRQMLLVKHFDLFKKYPVLLASHYFRLGLWSRDSGQYVQARDYFKKAWRNYYSWRYLLHFVSLLFGARPWKLFKKLYS